MGVAWPWIENRILIRLIKRLSFRFIAQFGSCTKAATTTTTTNKNHKQNITKMTIYEKEKNPIKKRKILIIKEPNPNPFIEGFRCFKGPAFA